MSLLLDAVYVLLAVLTSPWWMRTSRAGWRERFGHTRALPTPSRPRLLIHAVSVGEVNLTRPLVDAIGDDVDVVIASTTDTGMARARVLYADRCEVVRFPLDASWSVRRFLNAVQPTALALVELELWPNTMQECRARGIPVAVVNGRLSARSFRGYHLGRWFIGRFFRQLAFAAVQDETYAQRFIAMGVDPARCIVAGTMKWDAAQRSEQIEGAEALAQSLGIDRSRPLIVAGSTAPDEHALLHDATPPGVQLLCAPRRLEWFDEAALALPGCVRRSASSDSPHIDAGTRAARASDRFLLDTIGELRLAYALADIVVVGRSFGDLFGSDPMEPAALGKPVIIGPAIEDFRTIVEAMAHDNAIIQTTRATLREAIRALLDDPDERAAMGERARACVERHRGAARRHAELLLELLADGAHREPIAKADRHV